MPESTFRNFHLDKDFDVEELLQSAHATPADINKTVKEIITQVCKNGDNALIEYTAQLDNFQVADMDSLHLNNSQLQLYLQKTDANIRSALEKAHERIVWFHQQQLERDWTVHDEAGNILGQRIHPINRVGIYVPGGRASYPSSVLMNAIPARVAGVGSITMVMPCPHGKYNYTVLAAAALCNVDNVVLIGGAQAIAALACGTKSIAPVDKITGPGNAYVAEAKRQLFGKVGIDMIAGPSEIVIIGDGSVNPHWVALDLCAQAEHDPDARAFLLSNSLDYIEQVQRAIETQIATLSRAEIIRQSFANNGGFVYCQSINHACQLANRIAPEHLQLCVDTPEVYEKAIVNAGAVFVGAYSCEALGDYCVGPNHVLPTMGSARFSSPLGVYDFTRRSSYIRCTNNQIKTLIDITNTLAQAEGLDAHALSARVRTSDNIGE